MQQAWKGVSHLNPSDITVCNLNGKQQHTHQNTGEVCHLFEMMVIFMYVEVYG